MAEDVRHLFGALVDSEPKARLLSFYQGNPSVIETLEGLARRLGTSVDAMRQAVAAHVQLGFLRERQAGSKVVLVYDRAQHRRLQDTIRQEMDRRLREARA